MKSDFVQTRYLKHRFFVLFFTSLIVLYYSSSFVFLMRQLDFKITLISDFLLLYCNVVTLVYN